MHTLQQAVCRSSQRCPGWYRRSARATRTSTRSGGVRDLNWAATASARSCSRVGADHALDTPLVPTQHLAVLLPGPDGTYISLQQGEQIAHLTHRLSTLDT